MSASWKLNIISPGRSAGPASGAGAGGGGVIDGAGGMGLGVALRPFAGAWNGVGTAFLEGVADGCAGVPTSGAAFPAGAGAVDGCAGAAAAGACPSVIGCACCAWTYGAARKIPVITPASVAMT